MSARHNVIIGISGASGAAIGVRIVERLADHRACVVHLVVSSAAKRTLREEVSGESLARLRDLAAHTYDAADIGARIASGSFPSAGMIIAPCSIRTLSAIAWGHLDNLMARAADVQLKERRRLVLVVRESPLHLGHLRAMAGATEIGAIIAPPMPAFYLGPQSLAEMIDQIACRSINLLGLPDLHAPAREWDGCEER
jgi:flavin prenyltransferase